MDKFPPELLHSVFIQLDLKQRMRCTLVCCSWWSALDRYSLLYDIRIDKGGDQFDRFMNMIKQSPHRAAQVEKLTLEGRFKKDFNKRSLCNTFPNLRYIRLDYWGIDDHFSEPIEVTQTASKIQHIYDSKYCEYALQMMHSNLCGQLETLVLDFRRRSIDRSTTIIPQLKNMPVLKNLTLCNAELSVADMEILHDNVPSIQTLILEELTIADSDMPTNIIPTTFLTNVKLEMSSVFISDFHNKWYLYISYKYVSVKKWRYHDANHFLLGDYEEFFYQNGFLQFLELIAPTQSDLTLRSVPGNMDVFKTLDNVGARIENFELIECHDVTTLENLTNSNQSKYVTKLSLMFTAINSIHYFENLPGLTSLTLDNIYYGDDPDVLNLTAFLNAIPGTLTSLSVDHDEEVEVDPVNCKLSSVMYLSIRCHDLTKDIGEVVSTCFPKLVQAKFFGLINSDVKFALQSRLLKSVSFDCKSPQCHGFSFKCSTQIKPQFYLFDDKHNAMPVTYEEAKTKPILSVVSYKKKSVKFTPFSIEISS